MKFENLPIFKIIKQISSRNKLSSLRRQYPKHIQQRFRISVK
eukprot:UN17810